MLTLEARKNIIEKLNEQDEVEKVLKVYVDTFDSYIDVDNVRWNSVDIFLTTNNDSNTWKKKFFRQNIC